MNLTERIIEQVRIMENSPSALGTTITHQPYTVSGVCYAYLSCDRQAELCARLRRAEHEGLEVYPRNDGRTVCICSGTYVPPTEQPKMLMSDEEFARMICGG